MPLEKEREPAQPGEARWHKIRLIASAIGALSAAAYHCSRLLIWLRNWP